MPQLSLFKQCELHDKRHSSGNRLQELRNEIKKNGKWKNLDH